MVLKRILVTTLGALGLGALAAGTASGQTAGEGNIPAPNIFDDQITCSMLVPSMTLTPTVTPMGAMTSPLDDAIGMGETAVTDSDTLGLGYVIPAGNMNCGAGTTGPTLGTMNIDANTDGDFVDAGDTLAWGDVPKDVADGYSELLPLFTAVYGDPGGTTGGTDRALKAAQKTLSDAVAAGTTGAQLTPLQNAVTRAQEAHNKAMAAFSAASGGPIYQAGVAEWMAKAAVTKSIADYNTQVTKTTEAKTALDGLDYSSYVSLANDELITTVVTFDAMGNPTVVGAQLEQYANADPGMVDDNSGTIGMDGVTDSTNSNFTSTGQLIVPMSLQDHDSDAATDEVLRPIIDGDDNGVDDIRTRVERVNAAAKALEKLRDDNVNPVLQPLYNEAARRARAEADYYNAEWAEVLSDTTNKNTMEDDPATTDVDEGAAYSIASRNAAYQTESNKRFTAEQTLRAAVKAREDATANVRAQFNGAQSFYEQLVARRMALKATADKAVTDASTSGPAPKNLVDAAADAQKALDAANKSKADLDALFADDDNPTVALITELLKTGGNDGQALVDAISSNYDTANDAKTKADEVAESVMGLTGDEGAVSMNTQRSMDNETAITALDGRVAMNEGEIWDEDGNSRIDMNESRSMMNSTMIKTNTDNIAMNATNIANNTTMIGENRGMIETNAADIMTNAGNIMANEGRIAANEGNISSNADAIAANMNSIGQNQSAISDNRNMIGELSDDLDVVRAGVAASMALAGMPAINGRGISIGVGSFDGESAFAVGFQIQSEMASFKVGVTSASGAIGASAGVGFQF